MTEQTDQQRKRPFGLIAIIILQVVQTAVWAGVLYATTVPEYRIMLEEFIDISALAYSIQMGSVLLLLVALPAVWLLKRWGWILLMIQLGISLSMGIWQYFAGSPNYVTMVLNVVIVFYLNQRDVQRLFAKAEETVEQTEAWI